MILYCKKEQSLSCVAILLATYNGSTYLVEQLESILAQTHQHWRLYVSDDGSVDETLQILKKYQERLGASRMQVVQGPRSGFAQNFVSLVRCADIQADYYAFCDQDDIWLSDKLERALRKVPIGEDAPFLYCSRVRLADEQGNLIGLSPLFCRAPGFRNALVQSLAGGNTMLFNQAARQLLARVPLEAPIVSHDWLLYLLVSGAGGGVYYDPLPTLDYRQHAINVVGANTSWRDRSVRLLRMLRGVFRDWNGSNIAVLHEQIKCLTPENSVLLLSYMRMRDAWLVRRCWMFLKMKLYRQTWLGHAGLWLAVILRKI